MIFANAWLDLFFHKSRHALSKSYSTYTVKLILDYDKPLLNINSYLSEMRNPSYQTTGGSNGPNMTNKIFKCQSSLNKLYSMLVDWCDILLLENCIYLKLIEVNTLNSARSKTANISLSNTGNQSESEQFAEDDQLGIQSSLSKPRQSRQANNSCLLIKVEAQYAPYVSVQFLFHSTIPYLECVNLLNVFEEKIYQLNSQSFAVNFIAASSSNKSNVGVGFSREDNNENAGSTNTPATTPTGGSSTNLNSNLSSIMASNIMTLSSAASIINEANECCHILKKTDIFDTMRMFLFDENNLDKVLLSNDAINVGEEVKEASLPPPIPHTSKTTNLASKNNFGDLDY